MIKKLKMTIPLLLIALITSLTLLTTNQLNVNAQLSNEILQINNKDGKNGNKAGVNFALYGFQEKHVPNGIGYLINQDVMENNFSSSNIKIETPNVAFSYFIIEKINNNQLEEIYRIPHNQITEVLEFSYDGFYLIELNSFNPIIELYNDDYYNMYFEIPDHIPVLDGETAFVTNVDDPYTVDEIKSHLTAIDNEDGDISHLIVVDDDDYTLNNHKTGTYQVIYSVTDSAGNKATLTVHVLVRDVVAPVISGQAEYTQSMTQKLNLDTIKSNLSVSDNYDTDLSIELVSDNYSDNYNKPGTHTINYKSVDASGNESTFKVIITVIDDVKPTISGPTTIVKGQTETLTTNDIKSQLTANDNHDGNITDKIEIIEDNYIGNGDKVGEYTITFEVEDNAGNKITKIVTIEVKDDIPPVFYVDNYFITVEQSINLTQQDFIDLLTATGQIKVTSTTTFSTILDEYTGNENKVGMYAMTFKTKSQDGNEEEVSIVVNVTADNEDETIIEPVEDGFFTTIWNGITTFFGWVWSVLKLLGNGFLWLLEWFLNLFK